MVRLIDADALIKSLTINPTECMGCPEPEWINEFIQVLNTAPSVLINCIQCKNYYETEDDNGVIGHCRNDTVIVRSEK